MLIGDYVNVAMQNKSHTLLAKISSLWEDKTGKRAKLIWMYFPEDTKLGRLAHHGTREVFESSHSDINPLTAIDSAAYVFKTEDAMNSSDHGHPMEVSYFCRCHYNETTGQVRPLNDKDAAGITTDGHDANGSDNDDDDQEESSGIHASPLVYNPFIPSFICILSHVCVVDTFDPIMA